MILEGSGPLAMLMHIFLIMLAIALLLAFIRLVRGPTLPDRVVAFDLMSTLSVGIIAVYTVGTNQPVFLDAAALLALISFLATVAYARYIELRTRSQQ